MSGYIILQRKESLKRRKPKFVVPEEHQVPNKDSQKQIKGKLQYHNRVDVRACTEGIAKLRAKAIDEIGKYPNAMAWRDIPAEEFMDAMFRHIVEMLNHGIDACDPETDLPHLYAVQWNAMVIEMKRQGREYDV